MKTDNQRTTLLKRALKADTDFTSVTQELKNYSSDFNGAPVILDKEAMKQILSRYVSGELSAEALYAWADFLEIREDIDYLKEDEDVLSEVIYELANPDLHSALTIERARSLLAKLKLK